jgi:sterol desaturase/sphingolipid hydroxylase (fatty acid hydroxylase superfamily)
MHTDFVNLWRSAYVNLPVTLKLTAYGILAFVLVTSLFYLIFESAGRRSVSATLRYVFPRPLYRHPSSRAEAWNYLLTMGFWGPLAGTFVTLMVNIDVRSLLAGRFGERSPWLHSPTSIVFVQVVSIVVSRDFGGYFIHYCLHKVPFLWGIHRVHHSAEALTLFTSARAHPVEFVLFGVFREGSGGIGGGVALYLTGTSLSPATAAILLSVVLIMVLLNLLQHCHVPISFGWLNYLLVSPIMHQIHHSAEVHHRDRNFGGDLMIFDWFFNTLYLPKGHEKYRWGLNVQELGANNPHLRLSEFYLEPLRYIWRLVQSKENLKADSR